MIFKHNSNVKYLSKTLNDVYNSNKARSVVVSDLHSESKGSLPFRVRLLAMCRGELSAVTTRLISKCL